jgi:MFS family permease
MTSKPAVLPQNKRFYGWIALSGAFITLFCANGFLQSFGVFLPVVADVFAWNRATVAAAISLGLLAMGLPSPLWGILTSRFGSRIVIILGNAVTGACIAGLYFVHDLWMLYLLFIIGGLGAGIGGFIPITSVANNWFNKKAPIALAMLTTAAGLAGFVFPPLTTALIEAVGWRLAWVTIGGIILIGCSVIGGVLVRNRPEDMGQAPDGIKTEPVIINTEIRTNPERSEGQSEWPLMKLIKMPVTWLIASFLMANSFMIGTMNSHQVVYMQDIGFSPFTAAYTMSILSVGNVLAGLAFGALALRINIRYLAASCFILQLVGLVILLTSRELGWLYIYSALMGIGNGALTASMAIFVSSYFGRRLYAKVMGFVFALNIVALAVSGTIGGAIYDATGGYTLAFIVVAVFGVIGLACVLSVRRPDLNINW